jgi:hypothetical protein
MASATLEILSRSVALSSETAATNFAVGSTEARTARYRMILYIKGNVVRGRTLA